MSLVLACAALSANTTTAVGLNQAGAMQQAGTEFGNGMNPIRRNIVGPSCEMVHRGMFVNMKALKGLWTVAGTKLPNSTNANSKFDYKYYISFCADMKEFVKDLPAECKALKGVERMTVLQHRHADAKNPAACFQLGGLPLTVTGEDAVIQMNSSSGLVQVQDAVRLSYHHPDPKMHCTRQVTMELTCDPAAGLGQPGPLTELHPCLYTTVWKTAHACHTRYNPGVLPVLLFTLGTCAIYGGFIYLAKGMFDEFDAAREPGAVGRRGGRSGGDVGYRSERRHLLDEDESIPIAPKGQRTGAVSRGPGSRP